MTLRVLTNSEICCYRECPRKHHYRYDEGLRSLTESGPRDFGSRWHKLLERVYRGESMGRVDPDLVPYLADYRVVPGEVIDVELEVMSEIGGVCFAGKLDAVVRDGQEVYLVEHKTTSADVSAGAPYWEQIRNSSQLTLYRMLYPAASGVVLDAVRRGRRPQYRQELIVHTRDELDRARATLLDWADALLHSKTIAKNTDACFRWGERCEFFPLCNGEQAMYRHGKRHEELQLC